MNVWVFNQFAGSPHNSSGAGERYHFISKLLTKDHGVDVTIFSASYNHLFLNQPKTTGAFTVEYIDGVRYCWVKVPRYSPESGLGRLLSWFFFAFRLFLIPKDAVPAPDNIIVSSMSMFPVYAALWKKLFSRRVRKVVFEIRDIWPLTLIEMGGFSKFNPIILVMSVTEWLAYTFSDRIVSVLPFADRHVRTITKRDISFSWIPNGIDIDISQSPLAEPAIVKQLPKDKTVVAYAGAVGKANAIDCFLEAHARLQNPDQFLFLILGTGPELERLKQRFKDNRSILFVGKVPKMEVYSVLTRADFLFIGWHKLPIYRFGVSANKYSDYMLARRPIISSGDLAYDPVREADCGVVIEAENSAEIAGAIMRLSSFTPEERQRLGDNGYQYLLRTNSMQVLSKKVFQVLES